jgi:hypothetical protein
VEFNLALNIVVACRNFVLFIVVWFESFSFLDKNHCSLVTTFLRRVFVALFPASFTAKSLQKFISISVPPTVLAARPGAVSACPFRHAKFGSGVGPPRFPSSECVVLALRSRPVFHHHLLCRPTWPCSATSCPLCSPPHPQLSCLIVSACLFMLHISLCSWGPCCRSAGVHALR